MRLCWKATLAGFRITLSQGGSGKLYTVTYGKQTHPFLDYTEAAKELGECIMHALAVEGRIEDAH